MTVLQDNIGAIFVLVQQVPLIFCYRTCTVIVCLCAGSCFVHRLQMHFFTAILEHHITCVIEFTTTIHTPALESIALFCRCFWERDAVIGGIIFAQVRLFVHDLWVAVSRSICSLCGKRGDRRADCQQQSQHHRCDDGERLSKFYKHHLFLQIYLQDKQEQEKNRCHCQQYSKCAYDATDKIETDFDKRQASRNHQ